MSGLILAGYFERYPCLALCEFRAGEELQAVWDGDA